MGWPQGGVEVMPSQTAGVPGSRSVASAFLDRELGHPKGCVFSLWSLSGLLRCVKQFLSLGRAHGGCSLSSGYLVALVAAGRFGC